jgi:hypothetical protein
MFKEKIKIMISLKVMKKARPIRFQISLGGKRIKGLQAHLL